MAYCIEKSHFNGYRCSCCRHDHDSARWVESLDEALAEVPREFPTESDGGYFAIRVRDGSTGKYVAESIVSWPPAYQRGDGYKFTRWTLDIDGEGPVEQVIEGTNSRRSAFDPEPEEPPPQLRFVTGRSWGDILDELAEKKRQADIRKAEADLANAQKRVATLRGP